MGMAPAATLHLYDIMGYEHIQQAPANGIEEYAMGMPHRGRLNVLVNILEKTYTANRTEAAAFANREGLLGG